MRNGLDLKIWRFMAASFLIHLFSILALNGTPLFLQQGERDKKDVMISMEIVDDGDIVRKASVPKKRMNMRIISPTEGLKKETTGNLNREGIIESGKNQESLKVENGSGRGFEVYSFDNGDRENFPTLGGENRDSSYNGGSIDGVSKASNDRYLLEEIRRRILNAIIYPEGSRKMGHEGRVRLLFHIGSNGRITEYKIISSSGWDELDRSVINALLSIKTYPPYDGWIILPVEFRLR